MNTLRTRYGRLPAGGGPVALARMNKVTTLVLVAVGALMAGLLVAPAAAQSSDPRAARDAARARRAQLASQLDELKASEDELLDAAAALQDQVLAQAARVDAARQAVAAAEAELVEATASVMETENLIVNLEQTFVDRAVAEFISPRRAADQDLAASTDLTESARRHVLLDSVSSNDDDLLDELGAAREDYEVAKAAAAAARERATARRTETESRLAELEKAEAAQRRLVAAVDTRQKEVLAEIDAQSAAESALTRIIREREAAARASGSVGTNRVGAGGCMWPAQGRVTSEYGRRWGRLHAGIDIGAPIGTPIYAAAAGTVIFSGQQSGYGNVIIIDHGGGFTTLYGHQSRLMARDGQSVDRGSRIGSVGNTGRSTGPHLHFETRYGGSPRNPRGCLG